MRDFSYTNPLYEPPFKIYPKLTIVTFLIFQIRLVWVFSTSWNLSKKQSLCHGCVMLCQSIFMPYTHNGYTNCHAVIGPSHWLEEKNTRERPCSQSGIGYGKPPERFIIIRVFHDFCLDMLEVMESFRGRIFHVFLVQWIFFVGVCDTQGVVMKKMTGMAVLGDFSHFVGRVRVPNGPPQGACSLLTTRHIYCSTSKKICLISSIFQGVLFGSKGWCMVTPYHPWRHPLEDPGW